MGSPIPLSFSNCCPICGWKSQICHYNDIFFSSCITSMKGIRDVNRWVMPFFFLKRTFLSHHWIGWDHKSFFIAGTIVSYPSFGSLMVQEMRARKEVKLYLTSEVRSFPIRTYLYKSLRVRKDGGTKSQNHSHLLFGNFRHSSQDLLGLMEKVIDLCALEVSQTSEVCNAATYHWLHLRQQIYLEFFWSKFIVSVNT